MIVLSTGKCLFKFYFLKTVKIISSCVNGVHHDSVVARTPEEFQSPVLFPLQSRSSLSAFKNVALNILLSRHLVAGKKSLCRV
jgi:hypothetical protein